MRIHRLFLAALLFASLPLTAQLTYAYVIPVAANSGGDRGTQWHTQLSVFNPHLDYPLTVSVTFLPTFDPDREIDPIEKLIEIPANATFLSDDVLDEVFEVTGSGSLLLTAFAEDNPGVGEEEVDLAFLVNSNTYNDDDDGTYSQTIPGVWSGLLNYETDQISAVAHGIDNSTRLGFRTNVGAVNLGRCNVRLLVSAYNAQGAEVLEEAPLEIPPLSHLQARLPVALEGGSVEFFVEDPCYNDDEDYAMVFPYTSTIDDQSGDPRYQTPSMLASPGLIFGKKATAAQSASQTTSLDPTRIGKKIDKAYAQRVRSSANRLGKVPLERGERGFRPAR